MFRQFLEQQEIFVFFITVYAGAGLIANDRRANALQIYLSKPLTRAEYMFGKLAILMTFLLLVTWVPAIVLLVVQIVFAGNFQFFTNNLYLFPAITVFSFIQVVTVAAAMLALSSLSNSSRYVGILYAALLFFSQALFGVLRFVAGNTSLSWISIPFDLNQVGDAIFRLPPRYDTPWAVSLAALVALVVALRAGARAAGAGCRGGGVNGAAAPVVAAAHLSKWYGQVIGLNDVTLTLPPGITGLLGPNGAGKSTFMKLITGQLKPSKGDITVLGEPIWRNPALYFRIGFCPEQDAFYERMTGLEWVSALVRLNGVGEREAGEMAHRALEMVDLARCRRQEDRRLQQGDAAAREAGAGAGARSRAADPR